jgi:hypothetical protein
LPERGFGAARDKGERRAALELKWLSRMMREHEDRMMERRLGVLMTKTL